MQKVLRGQTKFGESFVFYGYVRILILYKRSNFWRYMDYTFYHLNKVDQYAKFILILIKDFWESLYSYELLAHFTAVNNWIMS